jgi:hypothetical protein
MKRVQRAGLVSLMTLAGLNIWTGNPLLALWVGSRVQGESTQPKMGGVAVVAAMIGVVGLALARALTYLGSAYDRLTGHTPTVHKHLPWLRSMGAERVEYEREKRGLSALEIVIVGMVIAAVAAFEIWFFFYSPSPIDQRSGRG